MQCSAPLESWIYKAVFVSRVLMGAAFVLWKLPAGCPTGSNLTWVKIFALISQVRQAPRTNQKTFNKRQNRETGQAGIDSLVR